LWYYIERSVFAWLVLIIMAWRHWRGQQIDVVYVREIICAYWMARLAPRWCGARVVYEVHHLESTNHSRPKESWAQGIIQALDDTTIRKPARLVSLTRLSELFWHNSNSVAPMKSMYCLMPTTMHSDHPRDQQAARQKLGITHTGVIITYAGLTFAYRRLDLLVTAFRSPRRHPKSLDPHVFCGRTPTRSQRAASAGKPAPT
jgi:hypothetical protein